MKNNKFLFYCSYSLLISIAITGCKSCNKKAVENPTGVVTYENGVVIPEYEKLSLHIYQVAESAKINEATAQKNIKQLLQYVDAADEFDLTNSVKDNTLLWYKNPKDPSAMLNINLANGDISLNRGTISYEGLNSTPDLIKNDEAVKRAKEHLNNLGFGTGDENSIVVGHTGGINMAMHDDQEGDKIFEKFTTVRFDRKLDDILVVGHSRLLVQMGSKGAIQSVIKQWEPLSNNAVESVSLINREDVKKSIEKHLTGDNKAATKIIVKKINLIYYDTGKGIIEPALHIIGTVQIPQSSKDSTLISYKHDMVEPLLKNSRLSYTFMGEKHESPKQSDTIDNNSQMPRGEDEKNK